MRPIATAIAASAAITTAIATSTVIATSVATNHTTRLFVLRFVRASRANKRRYLR